MQCRARAPARNPTATATPRNHETLTEHARASAHDRWVGRRTAILRRALVAPALAALAGIGVACVPPPSRPDPSRLPFVATGSRHTCAISPEGAVHCWGSNSSGQLGRSAPGVALPDGRVDLGTNRRAIGVFAGVEHTCAILDDGGVKCWGLNTWGQLGVGDAVNRGDGVAAMGDGLPIVDLGAGRRAVGIAAGASATCALLEGGGVKCWGDSYQGALGYGDIITRGATPGTMGDALLDVPLGSRDGAPLEAAQIVAIDYHSFCAIIADTGPDESGLKCWGSNDYCELGIGTHQGGLASDPSTTGDGLPWIDLGKTATGATRRAVAAAGGFQFLCVLGDDGALVCWGDNWSGQLGIGRASAPRSCLPEETGAANLVSLPGPAVALGARGQSTGGGAHACALLASGQVTCWGENDDGQLGTGDTASLMTPSAALAFAADFVPDRLVLGDAHSCATSADGAIACWGSNQQGQLGAAASVDRLLSPTAIALPRRMP
jgi:alpha-tubulin suppressor-like RCC1 family protein